MKKTYLIFLLIISIFSMSSCGKKESSSSQFSEPELGETVAEIVIKDHGSIFVKFFKEEAPKAVENFITHAKEGYYDGLTFHRIMNN